MANASVNFPKKPHEKPLDCSTRDAIADGLIDLLKPSVEEIDGRVKTVRYKLIELSYEEVGVNPDKKYITMTIEYIHSSIVPIQFMCK